MYIIATTRLSWVYKERTLVAAKERKAELEAMGHKKVFIYSRHV